MGRTAHAAAVRGRARKRLPVGPLDLRFKWGIHDVIYRALCGVMTQAEQRRIPGCGHGAHRDNPAAFNETVLAFLRERLP
jgi:pimeloyl-ACP methyl ester carboxylesterase